MPISSTEGKKVNILWTTLILFTMFATYCDFPLSISRVFVFVVSYWVRFYLRSCAVSVSGLLAVVTAR
jgi:hypothetical protein